MRALALTAAAGAAWQQPCTIPTAFLPFLLLLLLLLLLFAAAR
jgi:hypothetical protein